MTAYYNEIDKNAAAWLRQLIKNGAIAPGDVDDRSITEVSATDLAGYTQCHFFAGVAAWSYALRQAGWPDNQPVWTGSPPCQSWSVAGARRGFNDDRHLWPEFFRLINECNPPIVVGEQVSSKPALNWWDLVAHDLETAGYAAGAIDMAGGCSGAYHQRQRLYWVGVLEHPNSERLQESGQPKSNESQQFSPELPSNLSAMGHPTSDRLPGQRPTRQAQKRRESKPKFKGELPHRPERPGDSSPMGNTNGLQSGSSIFEISSIGDGATGEQCHVAGASCIPAIWQDPVWIECTDGAYRPAHKDIYPLSGLVGMDYERIGDELERGLAYLLPPRHAIERTEEIKGIAQGIMDSRNWGAIKSRAYPMANGAAGGVGQSGDFCQPKINYDNTQEARAMRLKGYGNSIVVPLAIEFIKTIKELI